MKLLKVFLITAILTMGLAGQEKIKSESNRKTTYFIKGNCLYILKSEGMRKNLAFEKNSNQKKTTVEPPFANAGEDFNTCIGSSVELTAAGSYDPLATTLSFRWEFQSIPTGSKVVLNNQNRKESSFVPDLPGDYTILLKVTTTDNREGADSVCVSAIFCDYIPHAVIEGPGKIKSLLPITITLDGSSSYTQNGNITRYCWAIESKPSESTAIINNKSEKSIDIQLDWPGTYQVSLIVWNELGPSEKAIHMISVQDGDPPFLAISYKRKTYSSLFLKKDYLTLKIDIKYLTEIKKVPAEYVVFRRAVSENTFELIHQIGSTELVKDDTTEIESYSINDYLKTGVEYIYLIAGLTKEGVVITAEEILL